MITAIDTNILLDILIPNPNFCDAAVTAIEDSAAAGSLVICDLVYAELCVSLPSQRACDEFLEDSAIGVESPTRAASFAASRAWRQCRRQGGPRTRILADFLIGAHAQFQANCLLSRDRGFYRKFFPSLTLIDPTARMA